jgi:hypothetical protein
VEVVATSAGASDAVVAVVPGEAASVVATEEDETVSAASPPLHAAATSAIAPTSMIHLRMKATLAQVRR